MTEQRPSMGRIVRYRGKYGLQAPRPALIVTTTTDLDPRGVEQDPRLELADDSHVHLHVFTPSEQGSFTEFNVPYSDGDEPGTWHWPERV